MSLSSNTTLLDDFMETYLDAQMSSYEGIAYRRWDPLANLCMANLLCYYCFYLPHVLYVEGTVSFLAPQYKDLALISSIFSVALGLLARPLGGLFFGLEADSKDLHHSYNKSTSLLAAATLAIAFLPPYSYIGALSSVINIALRMTQGFALGGAYTCAALLAFQLAPVNMQGRYTSFIQVSSPAGYLSALATVIVAKILFGEESFTLWGWRATFLLALILFYFSKKVLHLPHTVRPAPSQKTRSQVFREMKEFLSREKTYRRTFFLYIVPTFSAVCVAIYLAHTYQLYFLQSLLKVEPTRAKFILATSSFFFLPFMVLFGYLADRWGTQKVVLGGIIATTLSLIPIYRLNYIWGTSLNSDFSALSSNTMSLIFGCWLISTISVIPFGPIIAWAARLLPKPYRATMFACCHGFAFGILATIAQLAGTYFNMVGLTPFAAIYIAVGINVIALVAWYFAKPPYEEFTQPSSPSLH